jgi:hypothetical protein
VRASVARSQQAFTATSGKNHGHLGTITATKYRLPLLLQLFHTDPAVFAIEVVASPAGVPCIPVAAGILADANIPCIACFSAVAACLTVTFHGHQFSTDIQILKLPHFRTVAVTTGIWHRWHCAPVLNLRQIKFSKKESFGPNIVVVITTKFYFRILGISRQLQKGTFAAPLQALSCVLITTLLQSSSKLNKN